MKKTVIICMFILMASVSGLKAQDTIDTSYYRYDNHFLEYDGIAGAGNSVPIQILRNVCHNGLGFFYYAYWKFDSRTANTQDSLLSGFESGFAPFERENGYLHAIGSPADDYMRYQLSAERQTVYGIAIAIDTIHNLTMGDCLTAILCTLSEDHSRFVELDSITLMGGEMGKRRWIEIPMMKSELLESEIDENTEPFDDCIDTVLYRQVLEFYFNERSYTINDSMLFWRLRISDANGSVFCGSYLGHPLGNIVCSNIEDGREVMSTRPTPGWDFLFPILSPLPDWEVPTITQVVPDAQKPDNPDPQDPEDPQDPDNPDNPGGDEGIGQTIGTQQSSVTIYPNPASNSAVVTCAQPILELTLRDINGRLILTLRNCGTSTTLDTSTLSPGLYTLQVTTPAATTTRKLAVK